MLQRPPSSKPLYSSAASDVYKGQDLYYDCRGARSQVETGDVAAESQQWNDIGAVDYVGKAAWMGHNKLKGRTKDQARAMFVKLFQDAVADKKAHFYP